MGREILCGCSSYLLSQIMTESSIKTSSVLPWLANSPENPNARLRLFCFPYAGGGSIAFRPWADNLPMTVEVYPVELPGRGNRLNEPPLTNMVAVVESLTKELSPYLNKPYAFFGHSMGAMIAFDLAHRLREQQAPGPVHLFVSGRPAPHIVDEEDSKTYDLPEAEFLQELRRLNGTPPAVFANADLMQLMIPVLRADFEVCETYVHAPRPPLDCSITAIGGSEDKDVPVEDLQAWQAYTTTLFTMRTFPGDHFYLHTCASSLFRFLSDELRLLTTKLPDVRANGENKIKKNPITPEPVTIRKVFIG